MRMLRKMQVATRSSEGGFPLSLRAVFRRKDGAGRGLLPWNDVCTIITGHYLVSDLDVIALQETYLRADGAAAAHAKWLSAFYCMIVCALMVINGFLDIFCRGGLPRALR
jgi:hypothetical protein